jgi:phosphoglycerate kinase
MIKLGIQDLDLKQKRVFMRVDFNVPLKDSKVSNDLRIREAVPTIRYALEKGAALVLASHLGRPKGKRKPEFSLSPVAGRLSELLEKKVRFVSDCIGPEVEAAIKETQPGEAILLENLRFYPEEEANDPGFAAKLLSGALIALMLPRKASRAL